MKKRQAIPAVKTETARKELLSILSSEVLSANSLSQIIGRSEKEVFDHLEHLNRSKLIKVEPAFCKKCGFEFRDRQRLKKPGKCPKCKSTFIQEPLFSKKADR